MGNDSSRNLKGKQDSFEDAKTLVGYMELHIQTPRALVLFKHLVLLAYIAGRPITGITREELLEKQFLSLNTYPWIVTEARTRLSQGLVPKNWIELFNKEINNPNPK